MKLSDGTQNFWSQVRGYALSSALTIAVAFHFYGWKTASIIAFFLFICFIWLLSDIKEKLIRSQPDQFNYETTTIEDYPLLNFNWFQNQTDRLKLLGFVQIMDYKIPQSPGFARCFAHPVNYCYAEVNEVFKATGESFARNASITSSLEQDWTLSSINQEVSITASIAYGFWRKPRSLRIYYPNLSLEELFNKHLKMRQQMITNIGVSVLTDVSWENYVNKQQEGTIYRKKAMKQKSLLLAMIEVTKFELNPKSEWLEDYAKFIR
ncbi:hypothetical protein B9G53_08540 [Pseudanabaena sp. SR411]|uniref:hypothetical protein n=1 Tax=Pseudanabaena sp. SR411 TaxID=1980935 RepID=UPI000B981D6A|nr:hypothetical protein [Pseudanabaena sp. SR411]OYQ65132.1 hypothetical protein B9G53_08540 [Pseudanabaena sp. SR411]